MDGGPSTGRPHSLRSWRLPGLLLLFGIFDDHARLGPRRSSSAGKCSSRRAPHRAPRTEGWRTATPQPTPTARRFAPPPAPSGGGQCRAIGPARGIGEYPSGLFLGSGRSPPLWSKCGDSRRAARPRRASEGVRGPTHRKRAGRCSEASTSEQGYSPIVGT